MLTKDKNTPNSRGVNLLENLICIKIIEDFQRVLERSLIYIQKPYIYSWQIEI